MRNSSKVLGFLLCFAAIAPAAAQGRIGLHAGPRLALPGLPRAPTIVRPRSGLRPIHGQRRAAFGRDGRRVDHRTGFGLFGFDGAGLGLATLGDLTQPDIAALPPPRVIPADEPGSCVRPLIIRIGRGLRHPARTRVVYGAPSACRP